MAYAPYTTEDLAWLRRLATKIDLDVRVHHLLATLAQVEAERDALRAERDALRDAAREYLTVDGTLSTWDAAYQVRDRLRALVEAKP
jgi:hypothetical protein